MPVTRHPGDGQSLSLIRIDGDAVVVEAVKLAEDRDALLVRMYESSGAAIDTTIAFGGPLKRVREVDLMENAIQDLKIRGQAVPLRFNPFQIRTLEVAFE